MSGAQFTKGPWHRLHPNSVHVLGPDGRTAACCHFPADADLVAASPDLFRACEEWLRYLDVEAEGSAKAEARLLNDMRAALRKARGETA